jgi:hypothetical protein
MAYVSLFMGKASSMRKALTMRRVRRRVLMARRVRTALDRARV